MDDVNSSGIKIKMFSCSESVTEYMCRFCDFKGDLWITFNNHIWNHYKSLQSCEKDGFNMKMNTCKNCNFTSYSFLVWLRHENKCSEISYEIEQNNSLKQLDLFKCEQCDFMATKNINLIRHVTFKHMTDEKCIPRYIDSKLFFCCKLCEHKSKLRYNLKLHILRHHTDPQNQVKYKCNYCLFETIVKYALKDHITRLHTNPEEIKWFQCDHCIYKSKTKGDLRIHMKYKHSPKSQMKYECSQCPFKSVTKQNLKTHTIRQHTDPKEIKWFQCDQCEYKAKLNRDLKQHIKFKHSRQSLAYHECSKCPYKTVFRRCLKNHMIARHTDPTELKWFKCDECEFTTKIKSDVKRHKNEKHARGGLQQCSHCSFQGARRSLKHHIFSHHTKPDEVKWFKCDKCDYKTRFKSCLNKHVTSKHVT